MSFKEFITSPGGAMMAITLFILIVALIVL